MKRIILYILLIFWMGLIFFLSNEPAIESADTSNEIVMKVVSVVENVVDYEFSEDEVNNYFSFPIRKMAHLTLYLVLGVIIYNLLNTYNIKNKLLLSFMFCLLYALSDEIHQLFVIGRSGEIRDVLIDSCGSFLGIFLSSKILQNTR